LTARLHVGRPTYQAKLGDVSAKWFVLAAARACVSGAPFEPERAARDALDKREVAHQQALTAAQAQPWRAYEVERTTVALDAAREALGQARLADEAEQRPTAAMALAEQRQADLEPAVAAAVDKEREAAAKAIAERDRAIEAWKHAGAIAKAQHAEAIADLERKLAAQVEHVAALEQRLRPARERATAAERKLANAAAREQMVAKAVADFGRKLAILERKPHDLEPSFQD
jgi:chromosome segregation ATPase